MRRYEEFEKHNVFRKPDWRFARVLRLVERFPSPGRCSFRDDEWIRKARSFLQRYRNRDDAVEREKLFWEIPGLYYANQIHEHALDAPEASLYLQARLLAGISPEDIAEQMSTIPDTVRWYEAVWFNVADRLHQRDWVTGQVIMPAVLRHVGGFAHVRDEDEEEEAPRPLHAHPATRRPAALPFLDASLKIFAYFGGPLLVDVMIHGLQAGRPLTSRENMGQWFDEHWSMTVRRRSTQAALQVEIDKYNVMELFATHARILEIEQDVKAQAGKRTDMERNLRSMLDDLPYRVGGSPSVADPARDRYDTAAAELRDDEILQVEDPAIAAKVGAEIAVAQLPPPRTQQTKPPPGDRVLD